MNCYKSNRGRSREKKRPARDLRRLSQDTARQLRGHEPFQPGADRLPDTDPREYRAGVEIPAQQPHGQRCRLAQPMPGHEHLLKGNRFPLQTKVYWPSVPLEGVSSRRLGAAG